MYSSFSLYSQPQTWRDFYEDVVLTPLITTITPDQTTAVDQCAQLIGYFSGVVCKADSMKEKRRILRHNGKQDFVSEHVRVEENMAKECMDILVRLPHTVLEYTGHGVYDFAAKGYSRDENFFYSQDASATELKNMSTTPLTGHHTYFGRVPVENDFPECGVTLETWNYIHRETSKSFSADECIENTSCDDILKYSFLPVLPTDSACALPLLNHALPKDRNFPLRVAFVLQLVSLEMSLCDEPGSDLPNRGVVNKFEEYLKSFQEVTPGRELIFGAITNLQECVFVALQAREPTKWVPKRMYQPYHSAVVGRDHVARELASFCASTPRALGLDSALFQSQNLIAESFLAKSRTGVAMHACWQRDPIILKVSAHKETLDLERALLLYLEARGVTNVPRIHKEAQEDLLPCYLQSCVAFSTVLSRNEAQLSEEQILQVWDILSCLHREGIVHRDIRADTIMRDGNGNVCLTDFTAAQFYNPPTSEARAQLQAVAGISLGELKTLYDHSNANTASTAVLWHNQSILPADEGCALIYTTIQVNFSDSTVNVNQLPPEPVSDGIDTFLRCRNGWHLKWWHNDDIPVVQIQPDIDTIVASLNELGKRRTDDTYTEENIRTTVYKAVKAVYRLKNTIDIALSIAKASGMSTRSKAKKVKSSSTKPYTELLSEYVTLEPREEDIAAEKEAAEYAALKRRLDKLELEMYARKAAAKAEAVDRAPELCAGRYHANVHAVFGSASADAETGARLIASADSESAEDGPDSACPSKRQRLDKL